MRAKWTVEMGDAASYTMLMSALCRSGRIGKAASPNGVRPFPDVEPPCLRLLYIDK